ncbi:MAG: hypothetical protein IT518_25195 [Burkholderiales bacterium]|nr:hypothetical protein [Burkholderiales bacterium]
MPKRSSKGRKDLNTLAAYIVGAATGNLPAETKVKNQAAVALGRLGGAKGGAARARVLTPEERSAIARNAALKRWAAKKK